MESLGEGLAALRLRARSLSAGVGSLAIGVGLFVIGVDSLELVEERVKAGLEPLAMVLTGAEAVIPALRRDASNVTI